MVTILSVNWQVFITEIIVAEHRVVSNFIVNFPPDSDTRPESGGARGRGGVLCFSIRTHLGRQAPRAGASAVQGAAEESRPRSCGPPVLICSDGLLVELVEARDRLVHSARKAKGIRNHRVS